MITRTTAFAPMMAPRSDTFTAVVGTEFGFLALSVVIVVLLLCMGLFAGIAGILRYRNLRKQREWLARELKWEEPLLEVLAGAASPAALWSQVAPGEELYFVDYVLRFARRLRGCTRHLLSELAQPYLGPVVERISTGDTERRARAVETIGLLGFERYAELIVAALDDPSPFVAMIAARNIARQKDPEYVQPLLAHMSRLADWSPRQLSALLSSIGFEATPGLRLALADPSHPPALRSVAADALRRMHDPEAIDVAVSVLGTETDRDLIAAGLRLIGDLGGPDQGPRVRPFCTHTDPVIRATAIQALISTGTAEDQGTLRQALGDESNWVAIQAARALLRRGDAAFLRALARRDDARSALAQQVLMEGL